MEPMLRIELRSVAYHATALPLSYTGWGQSRDLNPALGVTNPVHRQQCLTGMEPSPGIEPDYPVYRTGASPTMLAGLWSE